MTDIQKIIAELREHVTKYNSQQFKDDRTHIKLFIEEAFIILDYIADLEKQTQWQGIATIPMDGKEYLVCNMNQGEVMSIVYWSNVYNYWLSKGDIYNMQATHWLPLPTPPEEK